MYPKLVLFLLASMLACPSPCAGKIKWALWRERPQMATSKLSQLAKETDGIRATLDLLGRMQQQEADVILFVSFSWILLDVWCISEFMYTQIHINHCRGIFTPQFLSELPKVETNIFHFSCAINACDREANWPMALEILGSMGRHKARISTWHVQVLVYSIFSIDTWVQSFMLEIFSETWEHVWGNSDASLKR